MQLTLYKTGNFKTEIYTDASSTGWGTTNGFNSILGFWILGMNRKNDCPLIKELSAVKLALNRLANNLKVCHILLRVDNTTAISYINRIGGTKYKEYNGLTK